MRLRVLFAALAASLAVPAAALAHAEIAPDLAPAGKLQLYSLVVPTEKDNAVTTKVELTVPAGFSIDSFVPTPGWHRSVAQTGSGESAVIQRVTWTGGRVPGGEDSLFQFLAQPSTSRTYRFSVRQTYSDGSIVNWSGPESSDSPAPSVQAGADLGGGGGGGGSSTLAVIALVVGAAGLLVGGIGLYAAAGRSTEGRRPLA